MDGIEADTEGFIHEIQARPGMWDFGSKYYADRDKNWFRWIRKRKFLMKMNHLEKKNLNLKSFVVVLFGDRGYPKTQITVFTLIKFFFSFVLPLPKTKQQSLVDVYGISATETEKIYRVEHVDHHTK